MPVKSLGSPTSMFSTVVEDKEDFPVEENAETLSDSDDDSRNIRLASGTASFPLLSNLLLPRDGRHVGHFFPGDAEETPRMDR